MHYDDPLKADFRNFLYVGFVALGLPSPAQIQYEAADFLQNGPERVMLSALRGFGKSWITACFTVWCLYRRPDTTILCVSANKDRAEEFILLVRKLIDILPQCNHLAPLEGQRDGAFRFDCGARSPGYKDPSVQAKGISSSMTGIHVDVIVPDDVEVLKNSLTVAAREKLVDICLDFENILNTYEQLSEEEFDAPTMGRVVYLGTPQSIASIYWELAEHYKMWRIPAEYPDLNIETSLRWIAPFILEDLEEGRAQPGDPMFPERFPTSMLMTRKGIMGPTRYALQMLLDPGLANADNYPLKLEDFITWPTDCLVGPRRLVWGKTLRVEIDVPMGKLWSPIHVDQDWFDYEDEVLYIDPSGSGSDETGYCAAKFLNGFIHILALGGFPGGHDEETLFKLCDVARVNSIKHIRIEKNFGDGMYQKLLQPIATQVLGGCRFTEDIARSMKENKICDRLEPTLAGHRLVLRPDIAENVETMTQISMMQRLKGCLRHDDRVEALAGAVSYFTDLMGINPALRAAEMDRAEAIRSAEWFDRTLMEPTGRALVIPFTGAPGMPKSSGGGWGSRNNLHRRGR